MKTINAIFLSLGVAAALTACDHHNDNLEGKWTSAAPESAAVAGAQSAVQTSTFDFTAPVDGGAGTVTYTADYDVTVPFVTDSVSNATTYQVTASIQGTWTQDGDDHDDYLLTFDRNSLSVNGTNAPELGPVTDAFINSLGKFSTIEDVEVSKDGTHMTFEAGHPDVKYHFVRK